MDTAAPQTGAVTGDKVAENTLTIFIAPNAIGASELADSSVDTAALQDVRLQAQSPTLLHLTAALT